MTDRPHDHDPPLDADARRGTNPGDAAREDAGHAPTASADDGARADDGSHDEMDATTFLDTSIDQALRRRFAAPEPALERVRAAARAAAAAASAQADGARPVRTSSRRRPAAPAATARRRSAPRGTGLVLLAVVLIAVGGWLFAIALAPDASDGLYRRRAPQSIAAALAEQSRASFEPDWLCRDETEFTESMIARHGAALGLAADALDPDAPVRVAGISGVHVLSPMSIAVLVESDRERWIVLVDRRDRLEGATGGAGAVPEAGDAFVVDRREIGALVLVEVRPRRVADSALPLFESATEPAS